MSHLYLLTKTLRSRGSSLTQSAAILNAIRGGGGGHFHRPDPKLPKPYEHTRLLHLEDINTVLYSDYAPEYHMHLHSVQIQSSKKGWILLFIYYLMVIAPAWFFFQHLMRISGAILTPSVRPGKDHAHMAPRLIDHLKANNYENKQDALGRRTAFFYRNWTRQSMDMKPGVVAALETHGFKF